MQELLEWMEYIEDTRQQTKVRHTLKDILVIVLFATLANADDLLQQFPIIFIQSLLPFPVKLLQNFRRYHPHDTPDRIMGRDSIF